MISYKIAQSPNQHFNVASNGLDFEIRIRSFRGAMYASVYSEGELLAGGCRIVSNMPIFPKNVERILGGSIRVLCKYKDIPTHNDLDGRSADFVLIPESEL